MIKNKMKCLREIFYVMIILQGLLLVFKYTLSKIISNDGFNEKIISMVIMLLLTIVVCMYANFRKIEFSIFPLNFSKKYIVASVLALIFLIATPSNYIEGGRGFLLLIYGSIITPIYEELLFRGFIWNRLKLEWDDERKIIYLNALLFSFWHLGYIIPAIIAGKWMAFTKLGIGLLYGLILCYIRKNTKCCYSTILVHGIMNAFLG